MPNPRAQAHHDELFPGHVSTLAVTDPELIEVFDNFAFDEVLRESQLDVPTRLMVQLASMIACQAVSEYRALLGAALTIGVTPVEAKEVLYQAVPYVGLAKVYDFLHATNDVLTARGVALPLPPQATSTPEDRMAKGRDTQATLLGGTDIVDARHANVAPDERRFEEFLTGNCFGDHVGRGGLPLATRELLTFAMLVSLGGADAQVAAHVRINLTVGNTRTNLLDVLAVLVPFIGYPRTLNGLKAVNDHAPYERPA